MITRHDLTHEKVHHVLKLKAKQKRRNATYAAFSNLGNSSDA